MAAADQSIIKTPPKAPRRGLYSKDVNMYQAYISKMRKEKKWDFEECSRGWKQLSREEQEQYEPLRKQMNESRTATATSAALMRQLKSTLAMLEERGIELGAVGWDSNINKVVLLGSPRIVDIVKPNLLQLYPVSRPDDKPTGTSRQHLAEVQTLAFAHIRQLFRAETGLDRVPYKAIKEGHYTLTQLPQSIRPLKKPSAYGHKKLEEVFKLTSLGVVKNKATPTLNTDTPTLNTDTPTLNTDTPTLNTDTPTLNTDTPTLNSATPNSSMPTPNSDTQTVKSHTPTGKKHSSVKLPTRPYKSPAFKSPILIYQSSTLQSLASTYKAPTLKSHTSNSSTSVKLPAPVQHSTTLDNITPAVDPAALDPAALDPPALDPPALDPPANIRKRKTKKKAATDMETLMDNVMGEKYWSIEKIKKKKMVEGKEMMLVKWKGYKKSQWIPSTNLQQ